MKAKMKELRAFCDGYIEGLGHRHGADLQGTEDWVIWGGYDINFTGSDYTHDLDPMQLRVNIYPVDWEGNLPDPIHTFTI